MTLTLHLNLKNTLSILIGACVVGLAIIPLTVDPSHLGWLRWEIAIGVLGGVGVVAIFVQAIMQSKEDHERDERERLRDQKQSQIEVKITEVWDVVLKGKPESATHPTTIETVPLNDTANSKPTDQSRKDEIDGLAYRVVLTGKGMGAEMARELFKIAGREDEFKIDVDVLVEMYLVNTTDVKQFITDIKGTVEVDGNSLPLSRQRDFSAWDFNDKPYEYCLNLSGAKFDRSTLETLVPLFGSSPSIELEPKQPREGWMHFIVKDVDPEKLNNNRTYKFTIIDSLGKEHPITKAGTEKRPGEVTVRLMRAA